MEESILLSIKALIGIPEEVTDFDVALIAHINTVFMILDQIGVGPKEGFSITGASETWDMYVQNANRYNAVKSYVHHKVLVLFDKSLQSSVVSSINEVLKELEWRLFLAADQERIEVRDNGS